ncbi:carbohydrate-binding protein [Marinobacter sp.]|uniref:carbohydrate-binding protein n=1 Tax=Marinobacter sp. TaxID=50741 RepID=UPI00356A6DD6
MVEHIVRNIRGFFCLGLVLLTAGLSAPAAAEPCDPEESRWVPTRYYPAGAAVFHKGQWYESRELHEGLEPGITFDWIKLDSVPDCKDRRQTVKPSQTGDKPEKTQTGTSETEGEPKRGETASGMCVRPDPWQFSRSYTVGSLVSHGGQIWEAIRETNGDMPGMNKPPRWQLVEDHCALKGQ